MSSSLNRSVVNEIDDFGAGFRKPTWQDLLVVKMVKWPYFLTKSLLWWASFAFRRLDKLIFLKYVKQKKSK